ncbi:hypothetical protein EDI_103800 [Entamoeba dispar SAW760]|uniref:Uncharacterized protein n=1 Tax=Entamoeba dispar (strain ATCC PRA-260 / SAW760) TaxID=370354 RepID=B0ELW8_ENTDS|nr:uncharacterized protein EDI_103800 [Entamoeba dispar SAW760]EDR24473.1 hypothetical protein EDI_103800 [Entamoeba dispar SAW760]|eukprot:EDR24473.1 hypothetical protein EDI_103800 [Entamoeba dispar SAW760]
MEEVFKSNGNGTDTENDSEMPPLDDLQLLDPRVYSEEFEIPEDRQIDLWPNFQFFLNEQAKEKYGDAINSLMIEEDEEENENEEVDLEKDESEDERIDEKADSGIVDEETIEKAKKEAQQRELLRENQYSSVLGRIQQRLFVGKSKKGFGYITDDPFIDDTGTDPVPHYKANQPFKCVPVKNLTEEELKKEEEKKEKRRIQARQYREEKKRKEDAISNASQTIGGSISKLSVKGSNVAQPTIYLNTTTSSVPINITNSQSYEESNIKKPALPTSVETSHRNSQLKSKVINEKSHVIHLDDQ